MKFSEEKITNCNSCKISVINDIYYQKNEKIFCKNCNIKFNKKICNQCEELIIEDKYIEDGEFFYHINHFYCEYCNNELNNENYFKYNNYLKLCLPCYKNKPLNCEICTEIIYDNYKTINNKNYHLQCFKCFKCNNIINGYYFNKENQKIWHINCYSKHISKCDFCDDIILDDEIYNEEDKNINLHIQCYNDINLNKKFLKIFKDKIKNKL